MDWGLADFYRKESSTHSEIVYNYVTNNLFSLLFGDWLEEITQ